MGRERESISGRSHSTCKGPGGKRTKQREGQRSECSDVREWTSCHKCGQR